LTAFVELLHQYKPEQALVKFESYLGSQKLDTVSMNAVQYVTSKLGQEDPKESLLSRAYDAKKFLDLSWEHLADAAGSILRGKAVMAHPISVHGASALGAAERVHFLSANRAALASLKQTRQHHPLAAHEAVREADAIVLEPRAVTEKGIIVPHGSNLLAELAAARGTPVYVLASSWHTAKNAEPTKDEEYAEHVTGILSEHGLSSAKKFLSTVQKSFPWLK
jgi:hypothetical protein